MMSSSKQRHSLFICILSVVHIYGAAFNSSNPKIVIGTVKYTPEIGCKINLY